MTRVYIIRHAEAEGNLYRRAHGWYNSFLTDTGWKQVKYLEKRFKDIHIDAVYASDLIRTQYTAQSVYVSHHLPLNIEPGLREICIGEWEDVPWGYIQKHDKEMHALFTSDPERWKAKGSEDHKTVQMRMADTVKKLAKRHEGETIALFAHGCVIRALQAYVLKIKSQDMSQLPHCDNTGVTCITVENGEMTLEFKNDNSHLPPELSSFGKQIWWKNKNGVSYSDFIFEPINWDTDREKYLEFRKKMYLIDNKSLAGFSESCIEKAVERSKENINAVVWGTISDEKTALLELATEKGADENIGYIDLYFMDEKCRNKNRGIQLFGQAVSVFRNLGRKRIRAEISSDNERALGFALHFGMKVISKTDKTVVLEKDISR